MGSYLLSWMWPSTLCSSFPNMPQGLKFNTHLSPVLMKNRSKQIPKFNVANPLKSIQISSKENNTGCIMFTCGWLSLRFHIVRSRVSPRWYCAHNTLGLSTCMFLYVCKSFTEYSGGLVWRKKNENTTNAREAPQVKRSECADVDSLTHFSSSSVIVPLGSASTLLPQNLSFG